MNTVTITTDLRDKLCNYMRSHICDLERIRDTSVRLEVDLTPGSMWMLVEATIANAKAILQELQGTPVEPAVKTFGEWVELTESNSDGDRPVILNQPKDSGNYTVKCNVSGDVFTAWYSVPRKVWTNVYNQEIAFGRSGDKWLRD